MAFITKPAPFTIAIDGCCIKEQVNTLWILTLHQEVCYKDSHIMVWNQLPGRVWRVCDRLMQPFQEACQTAAPLWSHYKGRRVQRSRSLVKSWWLKLPFHGPKTKTKQVRLYLWTYNTFSTNKHIFHILFRGQQGCKTLDSTNINIPH